MELKKITESVYFLPGVVNIGCIVSSGNAILIDTGLDDSTGKKILNTLSGEGFKITAIINTHSHADHCGGNSFIKEKTGAIIYAPEIEEGIINYPYLEPLYLFSGAEPVEIMKNKFLMAKPSNVDYVIKGTNSHIEVEGLKINIVPLPGHSPNQIGVEFDGVLFCGDTFMSASLVHKHGIPFNTDIEKQRSTLQFLRNSSYRFYVPAHSTPSEEVTVDINENMAVIDKIDNSIRSILSQKKITQQILKEVCDEYGLRITNIGQYCLFHTALMAHLSSLVKSGAIKFVTEDNLLYWQVV